MGLVLEGRCVSPEIWVGFLQGWEYINQDGFSVSDKIQLKEHCPNVALLFMSGSMMRRWLFGCMSFTILWTLTWHKIDSGWLKVSWSQTVSSGNIRDILELELFENWEWGIKEWSAGYKPRPVTWSSSSGTKMVCHWRGAWELHLGFWHSCT